MISHLGHTIIQIREQSQVRLVKQTNKSNQIISDQIKMEITSRKALQR